MARSLVEDIGPEAASSSGGLLEMARIPETKSERDGHRLLSKKAALALPIPLSYLTISDLKFPILRLRDWAAYLADKSLLHMFCGLRSGNHFELSTHNIRFFFISRLGRRAPDPHIQFYSTVTKVVEGVVFHF